MKLGAHVSIAGGIFKAPLNAKKLGCETFQIFSRSPRGGMPPEITDNIVEQFKILDTKTINSNLGSKINYEIGETYYELAVYLKKEDKIEFI